MKPNIKKVANIMFILSTIISAECIAKCSPIGSDGRFNGDIDCAPEIIPSTVLESQSPLLLISGLKESTYGYYTPGTIIDPNDPMAPYADALKTLGKESNKHFPKSFSYEYFFSGTTLSPDSKKKPTAVMDKLKSLPPCSIVYSSTRVLLVAPNPKGKPQCTLEYPQSWKLSTGDTFSGVDFKKYKNDIKALLNKPCSSLRPCVPADKWKYEKAIIPNDLIKYGDQVKAVALGGG